MPDENPAHPPSPYYSDEFVTLYHGRFEKILPTLGITADLIVTDPPYGETSLDWDRWPKGWPSIAAQYARSMWCFGSMRMFLDQRSEFVDWKLSQDIVWEKHNGSGFHADRFRRVHEHALHWYRGDWSEIQHTPPTVDMAVRRTRRSKRRPTHTGNIEATPYVSEDGGPLLMTSVMFAPSMHGRAINETEKPTTILEPIIAYGCPPGGLVLDLFAGSCSTLAAARNLGLPSIGIEKREKPVREGRPASLTRGSQLRGGVLMARDPYTRLMKRLLTLHGAMEGTCPTCHEPVPCDTMRAVWIYDLETRPQDGGA